MLRICIQTKVTRKGLHHLSSEMEPQGYRIPLKRLSEDTVVHRCSQMWEKERNPTRKMTFIRDFQPKNNTTTARPLNAPTWQKAPKCVITSRRSTCNEPELP